MPATKKETNLDFVAVTLIILAIHCMVIVWLSLYANIVFLSKGILALTMMDSVIAIALGIRSDSAAGHFCIIAGTVVCLFAFFFIFTL